MRPQGHRNEKCFFGVSVGNPQATQANNNAVAAIEAAYQSIVTTLHANGIKVYGATMTSSLGMVNPAEGWYPGYAGGADNGPVVTASRLILDTYIRTSGLFDGVEDFDAATLDRSTGNILNLLSFHR